MIPMTYTGSCPNGHAYTRENTTITGRNAKICRACKEKPGARPQTALKPEVMDEILKRARRGETVNEISGEGALRFRGKGTISHQMPEHAELCHAALGDRRLALIDNAPR